MKKIDLSTHFKTRVNTIWRGRYADHYLHELSNGRLYMALKFVKERMYDWDNDGITYNGKTYREWYELLGKEFAYRKAYC